MGGGRNENAIMDVRGYETGQDKKWRDNKSGGITKKV